MAMNWLLCLVMCLVISRINHLEMHTTHGETKKTVLFLRVFKKKGTKIFFFHLKINNYFAKMKEYLQKKYWHICPILFTLIIRTWTILVTNQCNLPKIGLNIFSSIFCQVFFFIYFLLSFNNLI